MTNTNDPNANEYSVEDLLQESTVDFENLENELEGSQDELESQLADLSKDLKKKLETLAKAIKKEVKTDVITFYHDNKQVVVAGLKELNSVIHELLDEAKSSIDDAISSLDDSDEKEALKELRHDLVKITRKYNHKYHMLRLKLSIGNAGLDIKNFFHR